MKRILCMTAIMLLSLGAAMAQSPEQSGAAYAERIVKSAIDGKSDAIYEECMSLYDYIMELELDELEAFVEGFQESALDACEANGLCEEQADSLIIFLEDIVKNIEEYKGGDNALEDDVEIDYQNDIYLLT